MISGGIRVLVKNMGQSGINAGRGGELEGGWGGDDMSINDYLQFGTLQWKCVPPGPLPPASLSSALVRLMTVGDLTRVSGFIAWAMVPDQIDRTLYARE
jgi:hypothetical protein